MEKFLFKKIEIWAVIAIFLVLFPLVGYWGFSIPTHKVFPYAAIQEISAWLKGVDEGEKLSLQQKIEADLFGVEHRDSGRADIVEKFSLPMELATDPNGRLHDSNITLHYFSDYSVKGFYSFFSYIDHPSAKYGIITLSSDGVIHNLIPVPFKNDVEMGQGGISDFGKFIFLENKKQVHVFDYCGNKLLSRAGNFHHKASGDGSGFWAWDEKRAIYVGYVSKEIEREFTLLELVAANPDVTVLEARLNKKNVPSYFGQWKYSDIKSGKIDKLETISVRDPFHQNDVDVLTQHTASVFPDFMLGDLLISFRSINLIIIVDPETLKIKWYSSGHFSRQHDPDWSENGLITVYDNRSHQSNTNIMQINPANNELTALVSGDKWGVFQFAGGMVDFVPPSGAIFTNKGELVQVTGDEKITFAVTVRGSDGRNKKILTPRYFSLNEHNEFIEKCN